MQNRNALDLIINDLNLKNHEKLELLANLRQLGLDDDNDPIVKITLLQGIFAKYTGEVAKRFVDERAKMERMIFLEKGISNEFKEHFDELQKNIKIWKDDSVIEMEKRIDLLKIQENGLTEKIKKMKSWRNKLFLITIAIIALLTATTILIPYYYTYPRIKNGIKQKVQLIEHYGRLPHLVYINSDDSLYAIIEPDSIKTLKDGDTVAKIERWEERDAIRKSFFRWTGVFDYTSERE